MTPDEQIVRVLGEHRLHASMNICDRQILAHACDWQATPYAGTMQDQHAAHLAAMLAPVIAQAQAEAWDEGHGTTCEGVTSSLDGCEQHNPYYADDLAPPPDVREQLQGEWDQ